MSGGAGGEDAGGEGLMAMIIITIISRSQSISLTLPSFARRR